MKQILVDTSVWIEYFRGNKNTAKLHSMIDENLIVTNALILTELLPSLYFRKESLLAEIMGYIEEIPLSIDWKEIQTFQLKNLKNGLNNIGLPDLIILQNVMQNRLTLYTFDNHFKLMKSHFKFELL